MVKVLQLGRPVWHGGWLRHEAVLGASSAAMGNLFRHNVTTGRALGLQEPRPCRPTWPPQTRKAENSGSEVNHYTLLRTIEKNTGYPRSDMPAGSRRCRQSGRHSRSHGTARILALPWASARPRSYEHRLHGRTCDLERRRRMFASPIVRRSRRKDDAAHPAGVKGSAYAC